MNSRAGKSESLNKVFGTIRFRKLGRSDECPNDNSSGTLTNFILVKLLPRNHGVSAEVDSRRHLVHLSSSLSRPYSVCHKLCQDDDLLDTTGSHKMRTELIAHDGALAVMVPGPSKAAEVYGSIRRVFSHERLKDLVAVDCQTSMMLAPVRT